MKRVRNLFAVVSAFVIDEWWHHYQELRAFVRLLRTHTRSTHQRVRSNYKCDTRNFILIKWMDIEADDETEKGENKMSECVRRRRGDGEDGEIDIVAAAPENNVMRLCERELIEVKSSLLIQVE